MTYIIHRGAEEIGGSCVEIRSDTTRIVIDIGMPLMNPDGSGFDSSRVKTQSAQELIDEKVLPNIPGLILKEDEKKTALLISHAHQDHYGLIDYVNKKIPVYLGKATHKLIELTAVFADKDEVIKKPHYFENKKSFSFGDIEITPYLMDHTAFDAYAFLVRCGDKSLLYTGDFRAHGRKMKLFNDFLKIVPKKIDWLLTEGTNLSGSRKKSETEYQLEYKFVKTFNETKGINLVYFAGQNIDRIVTIFRACKKCGKLFVIDFYIANILTELAELGYGVPYPSLGFSEIKVFFPKRLHKKMGIIKRLDLIDKFEKYKISLEEIDYNAANIVMTIRSSMDYEIKTLNNIRGGKLIYSMWEGYKENEYTKRFLDNLVKRGAAIITIHTSGHADYNTLQRLIKNFENVDVKIIHTTEGKNSKKHFPEANITQANNGEIIGNENDKNIKEEKLTLLDYLLEIGKAHEKTSIIDYLGNEQNFDKVRSSLEIVCKEMKLNEMQAILLSDFVSSFDGYEISLKSISEFIGCKPINIIKNMDELRILEDRNLILINNVKTLDKFDNKLTFDIDLETFETLKNNTLMEKINNEISTDEFLTNIVKLCEKRVEKKVSFPRTIKNMNILLNNSSHLDLVKTIKSYSLPDEAMLILLRFYHYFIDLNKDEMDIEILSYLYDYYSDFRKTKKQLEAGTYILQDKKLIQYADIGSYENAQAFSLTENAKDDLFSAIKEQLPQKKIQNITPAGNINAKNLFYSEKNAKQVTELTDLLQEKNYKSVQERLSKEGMRTGFACLFSGGPGTGKTETVYQIARQTGRGIMQVDISDTKSKWFGESEKK